MVLTETISFMSEKLKSSFWNWGMHLGKSYSQSQVKNEKKNYYWLKFNKIPSIWILIEVVFTDITVDVQDFSFGHSVDKNFSYILVVRVWSLAVHLNLIRSEKTQVM